MPLQNRVDPFGEIHAVSARGMFTGNRGGAIHDPATKTLLRKRWSNKSWIICACEFKGRRRELMGRNPNGGAAWTELFFLDEVTALAAGHRPCFFCRREVAKEYAAGFSRAFRVAKPTVKMMDERLHAERMASCGASGDVANAGLPDGVMIHDGDIAYALRGGQALRWSFEGYGDPVALSSLDLQALRVLTPATSVAVFAAGFTPVWHPSAR